MFKLGKNKKLVLIIIFCLLLSIIATYTLLKGFRMQQQLTYMEDPQEVLSLLQSVEPEVYQVKSINFTSFFEPEGLYWIGEKNEVNECLQDVVLMLEHPEGDTFFASGTVQLANGDEKDSYLEAYSENNADERIESGLYQGILSVHPKIYSSKGCS